MSNFKCLNILLRKWAVKLVGRCHNGLSGRYPFTHNSEDVKATWVSLTYVKSFRTLLTFVLVRVDSLIIYAFITTLSSALSWPPFLLVLLTSLLHLPFSSHHPSTPLGPIMTTILPCSAEEARVQAGCPAQNQPGYLCAASSKGAARLAMACAAGSSAVVEAVRLGCSVSDWQ